MIRTIRGVRVMLDRDLAKIYGVPTFRFNEAIKRNRHRFPADFMFQLTPAEFDKLKAQPANSSQIAMSSGKHRGATYRPYAFTEHGALQAANVLRSPRAVQMTGRPKALSHLEHVIGASSYAGRYGSHTHLNGVYWLKIMTRRNDGALLISNLHDCGKKKVKNVSMTIEPDFVFPLVRGRDVDRWNAKASCEILIPQDPDDPAKGYPEKDMQTRFPKTYAYLKQFEEQLRERSGFKQFFDVETAPVYSVYNVGRYTFSPYKVCWREVAADIRAAVCSPTADKVVTFDHTLVGVSCHSDQEAHFICALLNSAPANFVVRGYVTLHPSPSILKYIRIPQFDAKEKLHVQLAESSKACHAATATGNDSALESLKAANNSLAAKLWELSDAELKDIEDSLADLS